MRLPLMSTEVVVRTLESWALNPRAETTPHIMMHFTILSLTSFA
jgi:hypothetical protein